MILFLILKALQLIILKKIRRDCLEQHDDASDDGEVCNIFSLPAKG